MIRKRKSCSLITLVLIIVGYFLILTVSPLHAQLADTAWPMFKRNTRHTGQSSFIGPENNTLKWKYALISGVIDGSPIIGTDNTTYICNSGVVFAINKDGSLKWRCDVHLGGSGGSTLAISSDGTIYAPIYHSLYALNPDGILKWEYRSDTEVASSPCIGINGIVYIGSGLDLLAIKPDGTLLWKYRVGEDVNSSPAIGQDGTIYVRGRMNFLVALNPNGTEKWTINLGSTLSHTSLSPSPGHDGTIYTFGLMDDGNPYTTGQTTGLHAINPNGSSKWVFGDIRFNDETIGMTPAIGPDGTIYLSGSVIGEWNPVVFYAISSSGILQWTFEIPEGHWFSSSSPAIDANGVIYFGTWGHHLYALNPNGTLKWEFETLNNIDSSPAIGSGGTIYFGSWDGYLYAIGETIMNGCEGDFDNDKDVDGSDLAVFAANFGRTDCATAPPCKGDFDGDGNVDEADLAAFAANFGRTDCP